MKAIINRNMIPNNILSAKDLSLKAFFTLHLRATTLCCIAMCFLSIKTYAQSDSIKANIHVIARPTTESILLRWAPGDYKYWDLGNKYGYKLVRYTLMRDSVLLLEPEYKNMATDGIAAWPLNEWKELVEKGKYGGIAAQAIYGESFVVDAGLGTTPEKVTYKAREQMQRFSFALYVADVSPEVAEASGLWFTDNSVKKNEMYLYRVFFNLPDSLSNINDTAFVFTGIRDFTPLPVPIELSAEFGDRTALLSWNVFAQNNIYIAWDLERSTNGKTFSAVNIDPIVAVTPAKDANPEYTYKYDSIPDNKKEVFYRLRGISSFGEYGPWSEVISGKGIEEIKAVPNITTHEIIKERVKINWEFPEDMESTITGFKILRSNNHELNFEEIYSKLKPSERTYTDKKPLGTNYYKVMAYRDSIPGKSGFAHMVQLTDNTPPVKPQSLTGLIDSAGIVTLTWKPNPDEDIYGYRVFHSSSGNDEYSQLTHRPVVDTFFIDTINKKDLNPSVFYKIVAIDLRQNQSEFSAIAELIKPDDTPPSIPVITNILAQLNGIELTWINSTSSDVAKHEVYRIAKGDSVWNKITEIPYKKASKETKFIDENCSVTSPNQYKVFAVDKSDNFSEPSLSILIKGLQNRMKPNLQKISKKVNYEEGKIYLSWELPESSVKLIKTYRKFNEEPYAIYETLNGDATEFEDYGMKVSEHYAYRFKLVFDDGSISGFSDEIKIEY